MDFHALAKRRTMAQKIFLVTGIVFIAFNLRPAITSVGPLVSFIRSDLGLSNGMAGFLTTLPLIAFAVLSPFAPKIGQKIGNELTILLGVALIGAGIVIRSMGSISLLFIGTAVAGIGIAVGNVLLPGIVKMKFPNKATLMTGVYSASLGISAAIASGISIPLVEKFGWGWEASLMTWAYLALAAFLIWIPQIRKQKVFEGRVKIIKYGNSMLKSKLAWQVAFFMGLQSLIFYCLITWVPEILYSHGFSRSLSGWMLSVIQFAGLPASFIIPVVAGKLNNQRGLVLGLGTVYLISFTGLMFGGGPLIFLWVVMIGVAQGSGFSLALTFLVLRAKGVMDASRLSGMAQSLGYFLAAAGPTLIGYEYDHTHSWFLPIMTLIIVSVLMTAAGLGAGRNKFVLED
ncbi:MFS transporter [Siminovitchia fortis]|uniref:MFS transporter n=1 Tax=Siminovitchia fortis TaxID=254758 RepID=A0A451GBT4_9BACI|nr:MFS transporter [Siminovitchia fortis]RWR12524.1 MFS transporter [Siminovitchia fortis]WHY81633.1 MFS transporter [Siminovitchia fortis]